ncbi:MAG: hypothetical protein FWG38_04980, partial [Defluviitaleaceae bacterium]|nr:hypothetical protein [Defluviitaleaceae bacterium]
EFTIELNGDTLTITDRDGDVGTWRRIGGSATASPLVGTWEGSISNGSTNVGINITVYEENGRLQGIVSWFTLAGQAQVPSGSFYVNVTHTPANGQYRLTLDRWIVQPEGYGAYEYVGTINGNNFVGATTTNVPFNFANKSRDAIGVVGATNPFVGRWQHVSGPFVYYFANDGDLQFFADGTVLEHAYGEPGRYIVLPDGHLRVIGEWDVDRLSYDSNDNIFTYRISGDRLTITDSDGHTGTWKKIS